MTWFSVFVAGNGGTMTALRIAGLQMPSGDACHSTARHVFYHMAGTQDMTLDTPLWYWTKRMKTQPPR